MYFFAQYFMQKSGEEVVWGLEGLEHIYQKVEKLNRDMAARIRSAVTGDAALNALVKLDFFGKNVFFELEDQFINLESLFRSYFAEEDT